MAQQRLCQADWQFFKAKYILSVTCINNSLDTSPIEESRCDHIAISVCPVEPICLNIIINSRGILHKRESDRWDHIVVCIWQIHSTDLMLLDIQQKSVILCGKDENKIFSPTDQVFWQTHRWKYNLFKVAWLCCSEHMTHKCRHIQACASTYSNLLSCLVIFYKFEVMRMGIYWCNI